MTLMRKSNQLKAPWSINVFKPFIDAVGGSLSEFTNVVFERFVIDDFAYHEEMVFFGVEKYLINTVIPHKIAVYNAGLRLMKLGWWDDYYISNEEFIDNLWLHDISKFSANEAIGYASYDFKNPSQGSKLGFELAWHHHKMHNEHHPDHWLNPNKSGVLEPLPMPKIFIMEMIADWIGAGEVYGNPIETWLPNNIDKFRFNMRSAVDLTNILKSMGWPCEVHMLPGNLSSITCKPL